MIRLKFEGDREAKLFKDIEGLAKEKYRTLEGQCYDLLEKGMRCYVMHEHLGEEGDKKDE